MSFVGNAIGDVLGGITGANQQADAAQNAANTQSAAANQAAQLQWQQFQQLQKNLAPYLNLGSDSIGGLQSLLNNGSLTQQFSFNPTEQQLEQTPGYQFTLNQGMKNLNNQLAAKGLNLSGAQAKGLASFTTGLADQTYQQQYQNALQNFMTNYGVNSDQYNRLAGLVGLGENAAAGVGNAGLNTASNVGNLLTSSANSQGAAQIAAGNVAGNSLNSALGLGLSGAGIYSLLGGAAPAAAATGGALGLGSLGGSLAGATTFPLSWSDARLKKDIQYLGDTEEGNRVYAFRYKGSKERHIGIMAQEVEKKNPSAVGDVNGLKYVDYSKVH